MNQPPNQNCSNCVCYVVKTASRRRGEAIENGFCCAHPPVRLEPDATTGQALSTFPTVMPINWCRDWEAAYKPVEPKKTA